MFGQDEMPFEDNLRMEGEDILQVEYCMLKLLIWSWLKE
jgi:hypothetical protein